MSSESDDSDIEDTLLLLAAASRKRPRMWVHPINTKRLEYGEYNRLCRELQSDEEKFFSYFRMSKGSFEELHNILQPFITKQDTNWRLAISSKERLAICLRYLATGDSYKTIAFSFRVGRSTVGGIVENVCQGVWNSLQPIYIPTPTEDTWRKSESGFREIWDFPNCLGTDDLVPQVLIGDEGFGLKPYLMRPFTQRAALQDESKRNYNKRLSKARRVVENAFGILAEKWRVFHRPMECSVNTAEAVVKAACCLHNFLRAKEGRMQIVPENSMATGSAFVTNTTPRNNQPSVEAFEIREKFRRYFETN
ncbi:uncharacterized protein LOC134805923 [Cydia splendana]|uniref:uncharacterized protein LOC134805923 n=1 Tax=Cydia splendana TaxID=1100963 RepID=UPI00300CB3DC